ncbi:hypothetical protein KCU65_g8064, partial [Aureobasidium melanogenum]
MARRTNKNEKKIKNKNKKAQNPEPLNPKQIVKFLNNEPFFPSPIRVTPKALQAWLKAIATSTSKQAPKDVVKEVMAGLQTTAYVTLKHFV